MINLLTQLELEHAAWSVPWALADSHVWVLSSVGLCCPSLTHVWQQQAALFPEGTKLTPCNICRAGLWPASFSHLHSKTDWVGRQLCHCLALVPSSAFGTGTLFVKLMGSSCASTGNVPLQKNVFMGWGNAGVCFASTQAWGWFVSPARAVVCSAACWPCFACCTFPWALYGAYAAFPLHSPLCSQPPAALHAWAKLGA